jgi:hypothetical protein
MDRRCLLFIAFSASFTFVKFDMELMQSRRHPRYRLGAFDRWFVANSKRFFCITVRVRLDNYADDMRPVFIAGHGSAA